MDFEEIEVLGIGLPEEVISPVDVSSGSIKELYSKAHKLN